MINKKLISLLTLLTLTSSTFCSEDAWERLKAALPTKEEVVAGARRVGSTLREVATDLAASITGEEQTAGTDDDEEFEVLARDAENPIESLFMEALRASIFDEIKPVMHGEIIIKKGVIVLNYDNLDGHLKKLQYFDHIKSIAEKLDAVQQVTFVEDTLEIFNSFCNKMEDILQSVDRERYLVNIHKKETAFRRLARKLRVIKKQLPDHGTQTAKERAQIKQALQEAYADTATASQEDRARLAETVEPAARRRRQLPKTPEQIAKDMTEAAQELDH